MLASSSAMQNIHMECTQGKTTSSGDMTVERIDAEHASGNVVMKTAVGRSAHQHENDVYYQVAFLRLRRRQAAGS